MTTEEFKRQAKEMAGWKVEIKNNVKIPNGKIKTIEEILKEKPVESKKIEYDGRYENWQWFLHKILYGKDRFDIFNDLWAAGVYKTDIVLYILTFIIFILMPIFGLILMRIV